jgi:putative nucleotidyltransferase with HDIG domain
MSTAALPSPPSLAADLDPVVELTIADLRERQRRRGAARRSLAALGVGAMLVPAAAALASLPAPERAIDLPLLLLLVASYGLLSRVHFEVGTVTMVPTQLVLVPMLLVLPLWLVPLAVASGNLVGNVVGRQGVHLGRLPFFFVNAWHAVGPAFVLTVLPTDGADRWAVYAGALLAQFAVDLAAVRLLGLLAGGPRLRELAGTMRSIWAVDCVLAGVGLLAGLAAADGSRFAVVLVLPLAGLLAVFARERKARFDHALELSSAYRGTAFLLGDVVEADDAYTGEHSREVVELTLAVADELGLSPRERRDAEYTALLHDVGKVRIPNSIINKPGQLTPEEREIINTHTVEGEAMLEKVGGVLGQVGNLVRSCHERWDGTGYPDGLAGEEIPLVARIVCACDAYNAMTTDRPYRAARSVAEALDEMRRCAGTHFDPRVVDALTAVASVAE